MAELEIERKFLLLPCIADSVLSSRDITYTKERLEQYYVPTDESPYTRYRQKGDVYYKTIKTGEGMVRQEKEYEVTQEEYHQYRATPTGRLIIKERYTFEYENHTYELDTFHGELEGLCYLEIEFKNEQIAKTFKLPHFFDSLVVTEVTFDKDFNNSALANAAFLPSPKLEPHYADAKKHIYKISPFLPVNNTLIAMIYTLVIEIRGHRKNLLEDPGDVEELHQFRVSLRKLRALVKEFKDFFDEEWYQKHNKRLSILMKHTNDKRDNDVAMIDLGALRKELSSRKDKSLDSLRDSLQKNNKVLKEKLVKLLKSDALKSELKLLAKLSKEPEVFLPSSTQPLILVAIPILNARIAAIIDEVQQIGQETPYEIYHDLRIQFKKLRYMVELLTPIIDPHKLETVIKKLKNIQTILGDINDFHVQKKKIKKFRKSTKKQKAVSLKTLQDKMKEKEEENKKAFEDAIALFKEERVFYQTLLYRSEPMTL